MSKKTLQSAKTQVEFKVSRLTSKLAELSDKIKRASALYDDAVKRDEMLKSYRERMKRIQNYMDELSEIESLISDSNVIIVPQVTLAKQIEKADFAYAIFEGEYVTAFRVLNYPCGEINLINLAPLSQFS